MFTTSHLIAAGWQRVLAESSSRVTVSQVLWKRFQTEIYPSTKENKAELLEDKAAPHWVLPCTRVTQPYKYQGKNDDLLPPPSSWFY